MCAYRYHYILRCVGPVLFRELHHTKIFSIIIIMRKYTGRSMYNYVQLVHSSSTSTQSTLSTHTHSWMHTRTHIHVCVRMHVHTHTHIYVCVHMHVHTHTHMHAHTNTPAHHNSLTSFILIHQNMIGHFPPKSTKVRDLLCIG